MKRPLPKIQESVSELQDMLRTENRTRQRQRIQMLYLLKSGQSNTRKQVAQMLAVHRMTTGRWLTSYEKEGLSGLLSIKTKPNRKLSIPQCILHQLEHELEKPEGFSSYKAIKIWLQQEFTLCIPYKTVHGIVRYRLKAKLKVGRKSHVKKNQQLVDEFRSNISQTISYAAKLYPSQRNVRLFCQDESRFGLFPIHRRKITLPGIKPISKVQYDFEYYYLYGAADPRTGDSFFLELPYLDTQCFQIYVDEFSKAYDNSLNLLLLDRGAFHRSSSLNVPSNVALIFIPPYSPELNPIERLWEDIKDEIADELYSDIEALKNRVASILNGYLKTEIQSLTGYPYLLKAVNDALE
ncbi:MAG: IS630 family transposase [Candidatus Thorarchaeota archaeon]|jgi:transposase